MISSKAKNAIKVLVYLTEKRSSDFISLKDISDNNDISLKYLEQIMPKLTKAKYVGAKLGKSGGYRLNKDPQDIKIWDLLLLYEEDIYIVSELKNENENSSYNKTLKMWKDFYLKEKEYFSNISISDLSQNEYVLDFVI